MISSKITSSIDPDAVRELIQTMLLPAVVAAAGVFQDEVEANLEHHRSDRTGTAEQRSAQAKADDDGIPLAESVYVASGIEGDTVSANVRIHDDNFIEGYTIEFGHHAVEWGRDAGDREPNPFMRPAFDTRKEPAVRALTRTLVEELKRYER